jgi:hypothetical protein
MAEEKINSEKLEEIIEEITREVLERVLIEGVDIIFKTKCKKNYKCTGDEYTCLDSYKCLGQRHSCTGIFTCSDVHKWKFIQD